MSEKSTDRSEVAGYSSSLANPVKLLILDDSASDREILQRLLASDPQRDYAVAAYQSIEAALEACVASPPDCVLLDYSLGDGTGLDFLQALRDAPQTHDIPVVMLTGSGNEKIAVEAFRTGVQDYLGKGAITADSLQRAVTAAIYKSQTERLLETQRKELQRLFAEAQQANARKDQFLATLSHELRTPLTPILTAVTATNPRDLQPEELDELFATIRRNILLEARLIDDLLDLTRISRGKLLLEMAPSRAHDVMEHAIETCREEILGKEIRLIVTLHAERQTIVADSARLQQVFWNLLKNAVKFTPRQGEIRVSSRVLAGDRLEIVIQDTGIGIAPEVMPNIFRAFEQGVEEIPRRFGGLGLGLAIASALVEAHHGQIRAESAGRDQGAAFFVELPLVSAEVSTPQAPVNSAVPEQVTEVAGRVLLVEDHVDSARVLSSFMRRRGLKVSVARNIEEAVEVFQRDRFEVIVSDIGLPDGTGLDLLTQLSAIRRVPAIALSGYGTEADLARSEAAGFQEHLVKPVEWPKLNAALTRLLTRSQGAGARTP